MLRIELSNNFLPRKILTNEPVLRNSHTLLSLLAWCFFQFSLCMILRETNL